MRRRDLLVLAAGIAATRPLAAAAQSKMPTIGVLVAQSSGSDAFWRGFKEALHGLGSIEGQNIRFEFRSDEGQASQLPELAAELVRLKADVIVTWFTPAAFAAKQATRDIPIVMGSAGNPMETGLIKSLAHPGGNITGIAGVGAELAGKLVELIREMVPSVRRVVALANAPDPFWRFWRPFVERVQAVGKGTGTTIDAIMIQGRQEVEAAFINLEKNRPDAVIVQPSLGSKRPAELALQHRIPAVSFIREFAKDGGLMSYWAAEADVYRRAAIFVDKILKGAKPVDLPVEQPTKFELVVNLRTARELSLSIPPAFVARADEVIE